MHPTDVELIRLARTPSSRRDPQDPVAMHAATCDTCRGELALMEEWLAGERQADAGAVKRSPFEEAVLRLLLPRPSRVDLRPLEMPRITAIGHALAADGTSAPTMGLEHRATLYSEHPEVILRIMHDPQSHNDILQLTADDPSLINRVFIRFGDPVTELLTDEHGKAEVAARSINDPSSLNWQLQLPDATFSLQPLDAPASPAENVIDLPDGDSIAVAVQSDIAGVSLRVRPLRIHGREGIERFRVVVCQSRGRWQVVDTRASGECVAANLAAGEPVEIRLYVIE